MQLCGACFDRPTSAYLTVSDMTLECTSMESGTRRWQIVFISMYGVVIFATMTLTDIMYRNIPQPFCLCGLAQAAVRVLLAKPNLLY